MTVFRWDFLRVDGACMDHRFLERDKRAPRGSCDEVCGQHQEKLLPKHGACWHSDALYPYGKFCAHVVQSYYRGLGRDFKSA